MNELRKRAKRRVKTLYNKLGELEKKHSLTSNLSAEENWELMLIERKFQRILSRWELSSRVIEQRNRQ